MEAPLRNLDGPAFALVTGATSGVGLAAVRRLLDQGRVARVYAVARSAQTSVDLAEQAAGRLLDIVAGLGAQDSGRFIAWDGSDIPW